MAQPMLHTERLSLVPLADEHLQFEIELDSDPGSKTVVLKLSKQSDKLLARKRSLKVQITVTLGSGATRSVMRRNVTLKTPASHHHKG